MKKKPTQLSDDEFIDLIRAVKAWILRNKALRINLEKLLQESVRK
jgi:hypothetical protein